MNENSQALGRELNAALNHAPDKDRQGVLEQLDQIEVAFIHKVENDPHLVREVRRRVAEAKFFDLFSYRLKPTAEQVEDHYDRIRRLGFPDPERECTIGIAVARYYLRYNQPRVAGEILRQLSERLDEVLTIENLPVYQSLKATVAKLLTQTG